MQTVTIGYTREDGDFAVLATLNNNDAHMDADAFGELISHVASTLCRALACQIDVLERQDAPDYVEVEAN